MEGKKVQNEEREERKRKKESSMERGEERKHKKVGERKEGKMRRDSPRERFSGASQTKNIENIKNK